MNCSAILFWILFASLASEANAANTINSSTRDFPLDGYRVTVPRAWTESVRDQPSGGTMRIFSDPVKQGGRAYCSVETTPFNGRLPKIPATSEDVINANLRRRWSVDDWLQIYPNLLSAQAFHPLNSFPSEVGRRFPAAAFEFRYSVPQGIAYHVRAHFLMTTNRSWSLWCVGFGHTDAEADNNFGIYLHQFQEIVGDFTITK